MKETFRNYEIHRTLLKKYEDYHSYKEYLKADFILVVHNKFV